MFLGEEKKKGQERVKFFQTRFIELSKKSINNFHCMFDSFVFSRGQTIYLEGSQAINFYLIESGEVSLYSSKKLGLNIQNTKSISEKKIPDAASEDERLNQLKKMGKKGIFSFRKPVESSGNKPFTSENYTEVSNLTKMCFFGEESLSSSSDGEYKAQYLYTSVAVTLTKVYSIHHSHFTKVQGIIGKYAYQQLLNQGNVE